MNRTLRCHYARPCSRRAFLQSAALVASSGLVLPGRKPAVAAAIGNLPAETPAAIRRVSDHLLVFEGPLNVGIVRDGDRALLIDCGDGSVAASLRDAGIQQVSRMLFTHYHRDQHCGARRLAGEARIGVPAGERQLFEHPEAFWGDDDQLYRVYREFRPDHLTPTIGIQVDDALEDADQFHFGPARIQVLETPGHTDGSVSYLVEVDGRRVVFCGDAICGDGQIWDVYSLQKGFRRGDQEVGGYHGFMGDHWRLLASLQRIKEQQADLLVPSHGQLVADPARAVQTLTQRLTDVYENYVSISALRHYFPDLFKDFAGRPGQMPIRPGIDPPACLRHFGTTWMLVSQSGAALIMDVGSPGIVGQIKHLIAQGEIRSVEGLWVTHYHYDHTDGIVQFQQEFDCSCFADEHLADVLTRPSAWRLPCLSPDAIRVDRRMQDGQSWNWQEFKLTSFFYPGQTQYHDALLVETDQLRMLFTGDSHTMAGIDDYCAYNRNWLGRGVGFQYCLSLLEKLRPTHLFNCHVNDAFTFNQEEIAFMRKQLDQREKMLGLLLPWPHANYGLDATWVRADPYLQTSAPGQTLSWKVVLTNHANDVTSHACRARLPAAWGGGTTEWSSGRAEAKKELPLPLSLTVPANALAGRYVIPIDVQLGDRHLPQFAEALIDIG